MPYMADGVRKVEWGKRGNLPVGFAGTGATVTAGFEDKAWKGAPWHIMDLVWVKTTCYVIESTSTRPGYGYGPCEGWIEKGTFLHNYKRITDPSGKLWKGVYYPGQAMETPDGKFRLVINFSYVEVDMRRDHGTLLAGAYREGTYREIFAKDINDRTFTRAGFIQYYK